MGPAGGGYGVDGGLSPLCHSKMDNSILLDGGATDPQNTQDPQAIPKVDNALEEEIDLVFSAKPTKEVPK